MTAEIVNLKRARKLRARVEKEAEASRNRKLFGTPPSERRLRDATREMHEKKLSGHLRSPDTAEGPVSDRDE